MERIIPMRFTSFTVLTFVAVTAAFAASTRPETTTYIDGNLSGVSANTGGTLLFSDDKTMTFRTGLTNIEVPYSGVTKAELGAVKENSHDVPLYKVWELHKRFSGKTKTQLLIVNFKNAEGADQNMTLELAQSAASQVLETIQSHDPKAMAGSSKPAGQSWWGDDFWKTTRNGDKWSKPPATVAPEN
jgi:hypothetical protein